VPAVIDRVRDGVVRRGDINNFWSEWDVTPDEILRRNFYYCFLYDPIGLKARAEIGVDHIMFEVDYPHSDSNWPDSQAHLMGQLAGIPVDEQHKLAWRNASELFRHPVPVAVQSDPSAF
jgi:hypothetical protein